MILKMNSISPKLITISLYLSLYISKARVIVQLLIPFVGLKQVERKSIPVTQSYKNDGYKSLVIVTCKTPSAAQRQEVLQIHINLLRIYIVNMSLHMTFFIFS